MNKDMLNKIIKNFDFAIRRRVPVIHQTESAECGLACLSMICSFYGKNIDMINFRRQFNLSARGMTLGSLSAVAHRINMSTRAVSLDLDEMKALRKPCILHWGFNHFVVLISINRNKVIIHDPALGKRVMYLSQISNFFTGVALELWPDSRFIKDTVNSKIKIKTLINSIVGIKLSLLKIFCISFSIEAINLTIPVGTQLIMDHAIYSSDLGLLTLICLSMMLLIFLKTFLGIIRSWLTIFMSTLINVQWQSGLFNHLINLPLSYFERRRLGDIQSRFSSINVLQEMFSTGVVGALIDSVMMLGLLLMMFLYGGWLSFIAISFAGIYVLIRAVTYSSYKQASEESIIKEARKNSYFMETLYGIATIKIQGMRSNRSVNWLNLEIDSINSWIKINKMNLFFGGIDSLIGALDQIVIIWLGISHVISNEITLGMFIAFSAFKDQFSTRLVSLTNFLLQLKMMSLHNERISDIALNETEPFMAEYDFEKQMVSIELKAENLSYRYDNLSAPVFSDFNIHIYPGESVAIVGKSGTGKTTLMKVLCGLFTPSSGTIFINGEDITVCGINNYQKQIGCVMQDDKLFSGSIKENICGFQEVSDEEWMIECAKASYIHDVISNLPMGYNSLIGELGGGLSGGQKQRILIARAIYKKPGLIFMDEATSSLDEESESYVNMAIKKMKITRIIIAHRQNTISSADRIINLD